MTAISSVYDWFMTFCERDCAMETIEDWQWDSDANLVERRRLGELVRASEYFECVAK